MSSWMRRCACALAAATAAGPTSSCGEVASPAAHDAGAGGTGPLDAGSDGSTSAGGGVDGAGPEDGGLDGAISEDDGAGGASTEDAGAPSSCSGAIDDGDPCTLDACDPATGVTHTACAALDPTVATSLPAAAAFLVEGPSPIQTGVSPGTINPARAAVIRGRTRTATGAPLSGVTLAILDHPELGSTRTFADGTFAMAVNGGGPLVVTYEAAGYLPVARQLEVPWHDYAVAPDVALTPRDPQVTGVDLDALGSMAAARGSLVSDADGSRQATVLFPPGVAAEMILPDGSAAPLATLSVRATEYTVGAQGPEAMPATLPLSTAYTYAVELSVDEAMAAGALSVEFSEPLPFYVDNFLGFPVGSVVPVGYYDRAHAAWVPSDNGRVIRIVGLAGGLAELDTDGDTLPDDAATLAALGIADEERARLAQLYAPGAELWRAPIQHFTPWDLNWPYVPPEDACSPLAASCAFDDASGDGGSGGGGGAGSGGGGGSGGAGGAGGGDEDADGAGGRDPVRREPEPNACEERGSVIDCDNQVLGESISLAGTPYALHYRSDRVSGHEGQNLVTIPLSRGGVPASLKRIDLVTEIAGRRIEQAFLCPCAASSETTFHWDGKDAFGRAVQGEQPVTVRIGYVYDAFYIEPPDQAAVFGAWSSADITVAAARGAPTVAFTSARAGNRACAG